MKDRALAELEQITEVILDRELAQLRSRAQAVTDIRMKLDALNSQCAARSVEVADRDSTDDLALCVGQDAKWQTWVAATRSEMQAEMLRARAEHEAQRAAARRAFGRAQASQSLVENERHERRRTRVRRGTEGSGA